MLELQNMRMESSNVRKSKKTTKCEEKKVREPSNVRKELSHMMLKLHNVRIEQSNIRKKIT